MKNVTKTYSYNLSGTVGTGFDSVSLSFEINEPSRVFVIESILWQIRCHGRGVVGVAHNTVLPSPDHCYQLRVTTAGNVVPNINRVANPVHAGLIAGITETSGTELALAETGHYKDLNIEITDRVRFLLNHEYFSLELMQVLYSFVINTRIIKTVGQ